MRQQKDSALILYDYLQDGPLTNLQLEILKVYNVELPEEQLLEVRDLFARYFADKASDEMDKLWEENNWSNATMREWLKGEEE